MSTPMSPLLENLQFLVQGKGLVATGFQGIDSIPPQFRVETGPVVFKFVLESERWILLHIDFASNNGNIGALTMDNLVELVRAAKLIHEALIFQRQVLQSFMNFGWSVILFDPDRISGVSSGNVSELVREKVINYLHF